MVHRVFLNPCNEKESSIMLTVRSNSDFAYGYGLLACFVRTTSHNETSELIKTYQYSSITKMPQLACHPALQP